MSRAVIIAIGVGCATAAGQAWFNRPASPVDPATSAAVSACVDRVQSDTGHDGPLRITEAGAAITSDGSSAIVSLSGEVPRGDEARDVLIRCTAITESGSWEVVDIEATSTLR